MGNIKKILIDFFNLFFPPDNENQQPKKYELILFYTIIPVLLIIGFILLR